MDYATANGTALAGSDYTGQSGTLTFLSGDTSKTISVATIDDVLIEGDETVLLNLSNATAGSAITRAQGVGTINDNDSDCLGISFTVASNAAITEGANSVFTITKAGSTSYSCQVSYATVNGPAVGGAIAGSDFTATSGTLTFASGQTSQTVSVPTIDDTIFENTETFSLALSGPDKSGTLGTASTATATINDNDACNGAVFTISSIGAVTEGANSVFTITKTGAASATCTVNYATSNGTAVAPGDYTATSGTLSFTASKTSTSVSVPTINDAVVEGSETLSMSLSNPTQSAALGAPSTTTGTINDNDGGGACTSVSFALSDASAIEGNLLTFTVTKTGTAATSCGINYATSDGTASSPTHYTAKSGTLSFTPAQTSQTLIVSTIDNQRINGTLLMYLNLTTTTLDGSISRSQGNGSIGPNGTKCTVNCTLSVDPAAPSATTTPPTDTSPPPPTSG